MEQSDLLAYTARVLEEIGVAHFVTGSIASMFYGEPRFTADIDIVVDLKREHVPQLRERFPESDYYLSEGAALATIRTGGMFNVIHMQTGLKVDLIVPAPSAFTLSERARVRRVRTEGGVDLSMASPEDVILAKLRYYQEGKSDKHLRDIGGILKTCRQPLDLDYIGRWVALWGLETIWQRLLESRGQNSPNF